MTTSGTSSTQGDDDLTYQDLRTLLDSARELSSQVDLPQLLQSMLDNAARLTDSPDTAVILHNEDRGTLYFAGATGDNAAMLLDQWGEFSELQIPIDGSKAGHVFRTGESIVVQRIEEDPQHYKGVDHHTKKSTESMICVPLVAAGQTIGVMQILNKRSGPYTTKDRLILESFALQAGVALRNARLIEDMLAHMGLYAAKEEAHKPFELLRELNRPAHTETLSVLFADMRGFTQLCHMLVDPALVQRRLNEFLSMLSDQVIAHGGLVNKFLGDGLLALFRGVDHPVGAVRCAFDMVRHFAEMKRTWEDTSNESLEFLDIGIGITTDSVIVGPIGTKSVKDFTAFGNAVNLAAAFEQHARGGRRVLVDQITYASVKEFMDEVEGPNTFMLRKADQEVGHPYKQYVLKRMRGPERIFISHSHMDRAFVEEQLREPLAREGIGCWYSKVDVKAGELWLDSIARGLQDCSWCIVVVSIDAVKSEWVRKEVQLALSQRRLEGHVVPVTLDDSRPGEIDPWLETIQLVDARQAASIAATIKDMINS